MRNRNSRRLLRTSVVLAVLLAAACGSGGDDEAEGEPSSSGSGTQASGNAGWDEIVAAAEEEGSVMLYSSKAPDDLDRVAEAFEGAYPDIDFEYFRGSGADLITRLDAEREGGAPVADVILFTDLFYYQGLSESGDLAELGPGPNIEAWPQDFAEPDRLSMGGDPIVISYNTDLVDEAPTEYDSLVDDEYQDRVGWAAYAGPPAFFVMDTFEQGLGDETLEALTDMNPRIYDTVVTVGQAVASGEIAWSPITLAFSVQSLIDQGAPLDFVVPESGPVPIIQYEMAVPAETAHPNAAMVLADFLMTEEVQEIFSGEGKGVSYIDGGLDGAIDLDASRAVAMTDPKYADPGWQDDFRAQWPALG